MLTKSNTILLFQSVDKFDTDSLIDYVGDYNSREIKQLEKINPRLINFLERIVLRKKTVKDRFTGHDGKYLSLIHKNKLENYIILPLLIGNDLLGFILIAFEKELDFCTQEFDFLEVFSVQATHLFQNTI